MDYTKMFSAPRIMVTVVGGLLLAGIIYTQFIMPSPDPEYLKVLQTGRFAIGHARGTNDKGRMKYQFEANGKMLEHDWALKEHKRVTGRWGRGFLSAPGLEGVYLVIYDSINPDGLSILRCDCPIGDSIDFRYYVQKFEQLRKEGRIQMKHTLDELITDGF